jgi:hypothetical protein
MQRLRIFVSSPGDVGAERAVALAVVERLQLEFHGKVLLEAYLWERSLLRATDTFQAQIIDIQETDLALFILWARIGTPLPLDQFHRADGSQYSSGTEYEFERAREAYERRKSPEILCYLKTAEVGLSMRDRDLRARQVAELEKISAFADAWFRNPDGTFKSAFYSFEKAAQFEELIEVHLRDWVRGRLDGGEPGARAQPLWKGSPFRGLKAFDFEHALIYCGRTGLVSEALDVLRLKGAGFLMVTGMSGVGKSSLVKAGVLPILTRPRVIEHVLAWRRAVFKPNVGEQTLLAGFAAALLDRDALPELAEEGAALEALLRDTPALTAALMRALERATRQAREASPEHDPEGMARLIVVCDQFEEIFDETVTGQDRIAYCEAIRTMILTGRVWVIATLRADFFSRSSQLPETFRDLYIGRGGPFLVGGPRPAEIAQMIRRPAMMAGLEFERRGDPEEGLDDVLRDVASGNPTVLPLLEFTLDELWRRSAGSGILRFADYENLGGLQGALKIRADEEFARLPAPVQASLPKVLAALVHSDPTDERLILQNRAPLAQFAGSPECEALIDAFVSAHLFVGDRGADGTPVIGLAHEALLREWPPAVQWIEQNRETLRLCAGITAAAALWRNSSDSGEGRLMVGALLKDAARLLATSPEALAPEERRYVHLSIAENRRQRRRLVVRGTIAAALVALAISIPTIGLREIGYAMSFPRALYAVWKVDRQAPVPVSESARTNLHAGIDALASHLRQKVKEVGDNPELNAWAVAEIWLALHGLDFGLTDPGRKLREFMTEHRDPSCHCWRETDDALPNTVTTAWVLYALARYDQPTTAGEIESVLKRQGPGGWWSMYPATPEEKNASTSATAWTALALHHQLERRLVAAEQRAQVTEAIRKAVGWLERGARPGTARWAEYPPSAIFEKGEYLAASGLALHALRTVASSSRFDALWLDRLPQTVPDPLESEISKAVVSLSKKQIKLDEVRHYLFPWMLRTTVEAYGNGSLQQRARAWLWLEQAFARPLAVEDFVPEKSTNPEYWTIAETLFALRHVAAQLNADPAQNSRNRLSTSDRNRSRVAASM